MYESPKELLLDRLRSIATGYRYFPRGFSSETDSFLRLLAELVPDGLGVCGSGG